MILRDIIRALIAIALAANLVIRVFSSIKSVALRGKADWNIWARPTFESSGTMRSVTTVEGSLREGLSQWLDLG